MTVISRLRARDARRPASAARSTRKLWLLRTARSFGVQGGRDPGLREVGNRHAGPMTPTTRLRLAVEADLAARRSRDRAPNRVFQNSWLRTMTRRSAGRRPRRVKPRPRSGRAPSTEKKSARDPRRRHRLGLADPGQVQAREPMIAIFSKTVVLLLPVEVVGRRDRERLHARESARRRRVPHADEPVGLGVGERLEQDGVDDAEDRGVGADAQREDRQGREREARGSWRGASSRASSPGPEFP